VPVDRLPRSWPPNIARDFATVSAMARIYCHDKHGTLRGQLCCGCAELTDYAEMRLLKCPFGTGKTTCRECPIHCYRPAERATMRDVMIYAGPRMLLKHPLLAVRHLWLERRGAPPWPPKTRRAT
jgi:hypothetical protein